MNIFNTHNISLRDRNLQSKAKLQIGIQQKLISIFLRDYLNKIGCSKKFIN